jgi:hypothetical protein
MKILRILFFVVLTISLLVGSPASQVEAQGFASYRSGITLYNLESAEATVTVQYFDTTGTSVADTTDTIAGNSTKDYVAVPTDDGFQGSAVVSSSTEIAVISNITGAGVARGSYVGMSQGSTTVRLPILMKNHGSGLWSTWFSVQNLSTTSSANVTVDYAGCSTGDPTESIPANSSLVFDQKTTACLANGMTYATITSTQDIVVTVAQESTTRNALLVSNGFNSGSTSPYIPLVNANNPDVNGWRTAIVIMNLGDQSTNLTLTYKKLDGSTCTETQTIPSLTAATFAGATLVSGNRTGVVTTCTPGARLIGAAYIATPADNSTNQPLVATVNQDRESLASAYTGMTEDQGSPKVAFPLIMDRNGTTLWATSFNVMNVGDTTVYIKCSFSGTAGAAYTPTSGALAPNGVWENLQRGNIADRYVGSGQCTAYTDNTYATVDSAAKLIAVVNERGFNTGDVMMSYEAVNVVP